MTPSLKLRPSSTLGPAPRVISTLPPPMSIDDRDVAGDADAVDRGEMDEPGLFGARNDARADAGLLGDGLEEFAAVFGFAGRAGRDGDDLVDSVRFGQPAELREHLERSVHRLRRERPSVEPAGAEPDHFLLAVDDLERQVGADPHHDHVEGIGADVDGGETNHGCRTYNDKPGLNQLVPVPTSRPELLRKRLQRFTRSLHGVEGGDVRAVHAARVASRRLRELLPVLQVDGEGVSKLGRRLRAVTSRLGSVREVDVLGMLTEELHESGRYDSVAIERVKGLIAEERSRAGHQMGKHLPTAELKRIERKLSRLLDKVEAAESAGDQEHADRPWQWAVEARVARRADALLGAVKSAGALYLPDRLHAVRIGVKKLRYALELSGEITTGRDADLRLLKRTQDLLGRMHDSQMLMERVRQVQASVGPPELATWRHLDQLIVSLENGCRRLHGRFVRERPALEAMCSRLGPKRAALARSSQRQAG